MRTINIRFCNKTYKIYYISKTVLLKENNFFFGKLGIIVKILINLSETEISDYSKNKYLLKTFNLKARY